MNKQKTKKTGTVKTIKTETREKIHFFSLDSIFDPHVGEKTAKILAREKIRRMVPKPHKVEK